MLLKSSDFVLHDLSADSVFEGCVDAKDAKGDDDGGDGEEGRDGRREGRESGGDDDDDDDDARAKDQKAYAYAYELELVLRKWFAIDPSREMRAFVRDGVLVGASRSDLSSLFFFSCLIFCLDVNLSHALLPHHFYALALSLQSTNQASRSAI